MKKKLMTIMGCLFAMILLMEQAMIVYAASAAVTFGSNYYESTVGETFPVGVYITGDEAFGTYHVEISYDSSRLQYVSGATAAADGLLVLEGVGGGAEVKHWLQFTVLSEGEAFITVTGAIVNGIADPSLNETPVAFEITGLASAPIYLAAEEAEEEETEEESEDQEELGDQDESGNQEEAGNREEEDGAPGELDAEDGDAEDGTTTEQSVEAEDGELPGQEAITPEQTGDGEGTEESPGAVPSSEVESRRIVGSVISDNMIKLLIAAVVVLLFIGIGIALYVKHQKEKKRKERIRLQRERNRKLREEARKQARVPTNTIDIKEIADEIEAVQRQEERKVVIDVQDVCMNFKITTSNTSGIKEYVIQSMKKQIRHKELHALNHVNFKVYQGEVVGIIGTNGSGKSTLLKIVSGALRPSRGKVVVDTRKVQLLTLGTGFDMELTARENVYLNGSIIGYSKEFLDQHYDEIVRFAELEDFMEEKVKNFSSGMVSRLGFAIATVADAAEILILDEVLSVGDEFFRKKSLQRIEEMIHGGSTVLLVSHSMGTILEHCTKVVWIEKGKLQMVGEPKVVCEAYKKMESSI